jgi:arylsulfatase A-like enzyme
MSTSWRPNILLIIADDLGKDVVNITGSGASRTMQVSNDGITNDLPNLSLLLRNGLYFEQAWAQPACSPTRASIFTGTHSWRHGVGSPAGSHNLEQSNVALPTVLPQEYVSGLFGKWHLGEETPYLPTDHGWDKHVGTLDGVVPGPGGYFSWGKFDSDDWNYPTPVISAEYVTRDTVEEAAHWIKGLRSDAPWFATVAFHTPHTPFHEPPDGHNLPGAAGPQQQFNAMVQNMDHNIGRLFGAVGSSPIPAEQIENTVIIFIGDNGSDDPIAEFEEKTEIYEGGVRAPMIIADGRALVQEVNGAATAPIYLDPGKLNDSSPRMVHVVDLFRTIADFAGVPGHALPSIARDESKSLLDYVTRVGAQPSKRSFNFSQYFVSNRKQATLRNSEYKLNYQVNSPTVPVPPKFQLFEYVGGEIPGAEDDAGAPPPDLYASAVADPTSAEGVALTALLTELSNYEADAAGTPFDLS